MSTIVLTIRGFHAGYLGCYGNDWVQTYALDQLSAQSMVFDSHFANVPDPEAAEKSWRDGRRNLHPEKDASSNVIDLITQLQQHHVPCALLTEQQANTSFRSGWDHVHEIPLNEDLRTASRELIQLLPEGDPWLLWIDLHSLLPPWNVSEESLAAYFAPPEEGDEEATLEPWFDPSPGMLEEDEDQRFLQYLRLQSTYAAAVTGLDNRLASLFEVLVDVPQDLWLFLTSDHGLPLGEHGMMGLAKPTLHEEAVHLPLIVQSPTLVEGGHVPALTQSADLMPSILESLALPIPETVQGRSVIPLLDVDAPSHFEQIILRASDSEKGMLGLRKLDWAFLVPESMEEEGNATLFIKPEDRWEVNNVIQQHAEQAEEWERFLRNELTSTDAT